jgi:hypothetical protein
MIQPSIKPAVAQGRPEETGAGPRLIGYRDPAQATGSQRAVVGILVDSNSIQASSTESTRSYINEVVGY